MPNRILAAIFVFAMLTPLTSNWAGDISVSIKTDAASVAMGKTLCVEAMASDATGKPCTDLLLLPLVNGKRWGCHEWADAQGKATFYLPLPNPGPNRIEVVAVPTSKTGLQPGQFVTPAICPDVLVGGFLTTMEDISNSILIEVTYRTIDRKDNVNSLVCMQWEPWFGPQSYSWESAHAVPVVGFHDSCDPDVLRQHFLWFADMGVDFLMADWSNHIWGKEHWNERGPGCNAIIHATEVALEMLAVMRDEGIPVPKMTFLMGISNGPPATMAALNEELEWVHDYMVKNPRFHDLWVDYDGKPLMTVLDCGVVAHPQGTTESAFRIPFIKQTLGGDTATIDKYRTANAGKENKGLFTIRWVSTQLQTTQHEALGYWTWMDGSINPVVTYKDGKPEAVTVTPGFFGEHGWRGKEAQGRRGGMTLIRTFNTALKTHPRVVFLHQWNEYAGQGEGGGYGENKDIYVDSYSVELSDDLEPVSLTAPGYRGDRGGWGYYYANLTQALLDLLRKPDSSQTVMAAECLPGKDDSGQDGIAVEWAYAGKEPSSFSVKVDGQPVAEGLKKTQYTVPGSVLSPGSHTLVIEAVGSATRFPLSETRMDSLDGASVPLAVTKTIMWPWVR
jgi:hypothetical protein